MNQTMDHYSFMNISLSTLCLTYWGKMYEKHTDLCEELCESLCEFTLIQGLCCPTLLINFDSFAKYRKTRISARISL